MGDFPPAVDAAGGTAPGQRHKMKLLIDTVIILSLLLTLPTFSRGEDLKVQSHGDDLKVQSLCQFNYPSDYLYEWDCVQISWRDTPRRIFGRYWQDGLRFNRLDRRHFIAGLKIKVPRRLSDIQDFSPLPESYPLAAAEPRFILVDQDEMYLGAYEYGKLVLSAPVAVGIDGYRLQNGMYQIDAADLKHESSLYLMEGTDRPYPMHYGLRIYTEKRQDGWSTYWLHGRDVPGYPASHGCIGLYDEEMQKEYYSEPMTPVLMDARRLYQWVVGNVDDIGKVREVKSGPKVLIVGSPPVGLDVPLVVPASLVGP